MFLWNPWALPSVMASLIGIALAATVLLAQPARRQNQCLALALFFTGLDVLLWAGLPYILATPGAAYASFVVGAVAAPWVHASYLLFLSTLATPIVRPLRVRFVRLGIVMVAALLSLWILKDPGFLVTGVEAAWFSRWEARFGAAGVLGWIAWVSVVTIGLLAAVAVWRTAVPGSAARTQGAVYAIAFGVRDAAILVNYALILYHIPLDLSVPATWHWVPLVWMPLVSAASYLILAYGILRHQLFDIDLKLKWTIHKGTMVAVFVALFFVVSESAALFFGERFGPYLGILAAGLLLFAIAPLQRLAERVADKAMPSVADTPAYRERRREEVYRGAIEELIADGAITVKERKALFRLQRDLGLDAARANVLEQQIMYGTGAAE